MDFKISILVQKKKKKFLFLPLIVFINLWFCVSFSQAMEDDRLEASVRRLTTRREHIDALEGAFKSAQTTILVTNYGRLYPSLLDTDLFKIFIPNAHERGVKVYYRFDYDKDKNKPYSPIPDKIQDYFSRNDIDVAWIPIHAKIVAVDHKLVVISSFNWFTDLSSSYSSVNSSLAYEGRGAYQMTEGIWDALRYYRNKEFGKYNKKNYKKAYLFKRNPYIIEQDLIDGSKLTYVPTIEDHRYKILDIFQRVNQRIVILSPFVAKDGASTYQRDFVRRLLSTVLKKNIEVCFICLPDHEQRYRLYLGHLLEDYPTLNLLSYRDFHAKTMIMDDKLIAEGSFNGLCAARDETYFSHKHEATLICEGPTAKRFIEEFYQTDLGKFIKKRLSNEQAPTTNRKRPRDIKDQNDQSTSKIKRRKISSLTSSQKEETDFFFLRKREVEKDLWIHHPFWVEYERGYTYFVYEKFFEIISGRCFNQRGYCVRINGQYIKDGPIIKYFENSQKAKEAAYLKWKHQ